MHIGSLNKLEIQKAKLGIGAPVAIDNQIDDVNSDIALVKQRIEEVRGELARLDRH